ncbi:MAG: hypothetical protein FWE23_08820 [Chitinivibrionia bacterium]|nr:hypothetical protein [Chitinivibrionia bacterium]
MLKIAGNRLNTWFEWNGCDVIIRVCCDKWGYECENCDTEEMFWSFCKKKKTNIANPLSKKQSKNKSSIEKKVLELVGCLPKERTLKQIEDYYKGVKGATIREAIAIEVLKKVLNKEDDYLQSAKIFLNKINQLKTSGG